MPRKSPLFTRFFLTLFFVLALLLAACGSDDSADVVTADGADRQSQPGDGNDGSVPDDPTDEGGDAPIAVEPDGGFGDGAGPIPGAEEPGAEERNDDGTWHGAQVAETNCPGVEWKRVEASAFSFSVPTDFVEADAQPIDSEVGVWAGGNNLEVLYDYGWYSGSISNSPGAENEPIEYSGIVGEQTILRNYPAKWVGVYFGEVAVVDGQTDRLSMVVNFADANDEIIGRCIVASIEWTE